MNTHATVWLFLNIRIAYEEMIIQTPEKHLLSIILWKIQSQIPDLMRI